MSNHVERIRLEPALVEWLTLRPMWRVVRAKGGYASRIPLSRIERQKAVPELARALAADYARGSLFGAAIAENNDLPPAAHERVTSQLYQARLTTLHPRPEQRSQGVLAVEWKLAELRAKGIVGMAFRRAKEAYLLRQDDPECTFEKEFTAAIVKETVAERDAAAAGVGGPPTADLQIGEVFFAPF